MKVLIVDGSKQRRRDLVESLGDVANIVIQGAVPDLQSALRVLLEASPDVIVTGTLLPDGDGMLLIERIRNLSRPPTIVITANPSSEEQRDRYLAAGAAHYVDDDELKAALSSLARRRLGSIAPEESQRLIGRMTAGVVHDLNNYLNVIEVTVRLLRRDPEDADKLWQQMRAALDAIARLTASVMMYARGGAPEPELLDFGAVVRDVLGLMARIIPPTVALTVEIADGMPVRGVRAELEQLVLNLTFNSIDAMPTGGELHVTVRYRSAAVVLEVADTGSGLFALTTGALSLSTKRAGHGLGLGIVRGVIDRHHGALRVRSRTTGGTLATVMLPIAIAQ
jgi:signal transduction histidine kinase